MKTLILFLGLIIVFLTSVKAQESSDAFIVTIKDDSVRVVSPKQKQKSIGVIINNETFDKITSEIRSDKGVIERFILKPQTSKSFQVSFQGISSLFYVSIAPPFQAVELKFSQRAYEIPEKK